MKYEILMPFEEYELNEILDSLRAVKKKYAARLEKNNLRGEEKYQYEVKLMKVQSTIKKIRFGIIDNKGK